MVRGEIRQVVALTNLAEHYRLDESELIDVLLDRFPVGGSEGTPRVSEFLALEVGAALGIPAAQAAGRIHSALDLKYRHPALWREVLDGRVRVWQAAKVTSRVACAGLDLAAVAQVDEAFVARTRGLSFGRAMKVLDALIVDADTALAEKRALAAAETRRVWFGASLDGVTSMFATLDAKDAVLLKASTHQLATILQASGDTDPAEMRQAKALGLLANPARALQLIQASILSVDPEPEPAYGDDNSHRFCGAITVDPEKLLPKAELVVHLSSETLVNGAGVARVERVGALDVAALRTYLAHTRVTVRPVVDLNQVAAVDRYEIPDTVRRTVMIRDVYERFPYSSVPSRLCDLDHVIPWQPKSGPHQTRPDNLVPLSRRVHRAKTAGHWRIDHADSGGYSWRSPLGCTYSDTPLASQRVDHDGEIGP